MKNVKVEVGTKLVAFWGALHPIEEWEVVSISGKQLTILTDEGERYDINASQVRGPYSKCKGVGIYAA